MKTYKYLNAEETYVGVFDEDGLMRTQVTKDRLLALAEEAGETVTIEPYVPPTQAEIDAQQQADLDALNTKVMETEKDLVALVLILIDEINILRGVAGLPDRTALQFKNAHRSKLNDL